MDTGLQRGDSKRSNMADSIRQFFIGLTPRQLMLLALMLSVTAFLPNLGRMAFIGDEAIRTLVAFEMDRSGNFIVPTLNGEAYFNKPPLYNWLIYLVSTVFGYFGEWPTRLTTLIFLGLFTWTVFHFVRKQFDQVTAFTMALMLLTSGRILFWDSMLGLIDICFSMIIYLNWMLLYAWGQKNEWGKMFMWSYFLFAIAFMLKGLPAVVFQGISILMVLALQGVWRKKLFSMDHAKGMAAGIIPLLLYYIPYASQVPLENVFSVLLDQSMQRTATHHGLWESVKHIFTFPPEQVYHFLPWSLLVITLFHPKFRSWIRSNEFIRFHFWMLVVNLPVYWISVQVYPRYLLMFVPLFNMLGYYALRESLTFSVTWWNSLRYIFLFLAGVSVAVVWGMPFAPQFSSIDGKIFIWLAGGWMITFCFLGLLADKARAFIWLGLSLLVIRSIFNLVVLPIRSSAFRENTTRESCRRVGDAHGDPTWYIFGETFPHEVARFYTSGFADQQILRTTVLTDTTAYYLVDRNLYPGFPGIQVDSIILERGQVLPLMKMVSSDQ